MNYDALKSELADPRYGAMTDVQAAADLNDPRLSRVRAGISGDEVFRQTDAGEFGELTDAKKQLWVSFCGRDTINPADGANVDFVKWVFGELSQTLAKLDAARTEAISRATELGLPIILEGYVQQARAM